MGYFIFNFTRKGADKSRPLHEQAADLLRCKLWGIGEKTANREALAAGDQVLAFVGAPERAFVGHATLGSGVHTWTSEEAERYPGEWKAGVAFAESEIWSHPVAVSAVWNDTSSSERNPSALFYGGVVRIKETDFQAILAGRKTPKPPPPPGPDPGPAPDKMLDRLLAVAERLRAYVGAPGGQMSEDATRAHFINRLLDALGYTGFSDIDYGVLVESGDVADYLLKVRGQPVACVEAKKLGAALGPKEAAQVVKYASVLGVRWGIVTDGRVIKVFDPRVPHVSPENRLVFQLDLADFSDAEDFGLRLYPDLALLARDTIGADTGLERRAAQQALREILTTSGSKSLRALSDELKATKVITLGVDELAELMDELLA